MLPPKRLTAAHAQAQRRRSPYAPEEQMVCSGGDDSPTPRMKLGNKGEKIWRTLLSFFAPPPTRWSRITQQVLSPICHVPPKIEQRWLFRALLRRAGAQEQVGIDRSCRSDWPFTLGQQGSGAGRGTRRKWGRRGMASAS